MSTLVSPHVRISVPSDAFAGDLPFVANVRGNSVSSLHRGTAAVADSSGNVRLSLGNPSQPVYLRSAAKPFQVIPAILSGAIERFGITERELAVLCASHIASPSHTDTVLSVLAKAGLGEEALRCGAHPPIHAPTAQARAKEGLDPTAVCNNCSGAHAGMLLACRAEGWSIDDYGDPTHPLQLHTREILAEFAGMSVSDVAYGIDNCAVPTFLLPIAHAAVAFARLASATVVGDALRAAARRVAGAMTAYPEMVAGEGRFDTELMRAAGGDVVSKGGAEAFQGIGLVQQPLGLAVKITDGSGGAGVAALHLLDALKLLPQRQLVGLEHLRKPEIRNHQGVLVGRLVPVFHIGDQE